MPETRQNRVGLVHSCILYAHQTNNIYQALPFVVDFKAFADQVILSG